MRQDFFTFLPEFKLLIAGNHKPSLRTVDVAIRRRFNLVPFTVTIPPEERDEQLKDKLREEYPAILRWAIEGCLAWQREGLNQPKAVLDATEQYLSAEDALARWIAERCNTGNNYFTGKAKLFADWKEWCEETGEYPGKRKHLVEALRNRGYREAETEFADGFDGLGLKNALK
jgi:putative DNA primase/helicase